MSYNNPQNAKQNQQLRSFVNNVKGEIDAFWTNILDEFDAFSTDISNRLDKIEKDYNHNRQKYGLSDIDNHIISYNTSTENIHQYNNISHRPSIDRKKGKKRNDDEYKQKDTINDNNHYSKQQKYKKSVQNGNNKSLHKKTLSTMEIPSSFKLDPLSDGHTLNIK